MVKAEKVVYNKSLTNGILGPSTRTMGPVEDGGTIVFETSPGCWGPMITPKLRGGHEVCNPVAVEGAEVGDSLPINGYLYVNVFPFRSMAHKLWYSPALPPKEQRQYACSSERNKPQQNDLSSDICFKRLISR